LISGHGEIVDARTTVLPEPPRKTAADNNFPLVEHDAERAPLLPENF